MMDHFGTKKTTTAWKHRSNEVMRIMDEVQAFSIFLKKMRILNEISSPMLQSKENFFSQGIPSSIRVSSVNDSPIG